jgi:hypothetical protein
VLLASAAGGATAWFVVAGNPVVPGGPVVSGVPPRTLEAEQENARLREDVRRLQAEVAEARIQAAAMKAFPAQNPGVAAGRDGPPADPILDELSPEERAKFDRYWRSIRERERRDMQRSFAEADLRARLDRGLAGGELDGETKEKVIRVLLEGSERMQEFAARAARGDDGGKDAAREAEALGLETRKRLGELLTPEQLRRLETVLGEGRPGENPESGR